MPPANGSNGERPGLTRALRLSDASVIVIANMIGAGIFTTTGLLLRELGSPILMLALWVAGGFLALCGAILALVVRGRAHDRALARMKVSRSA